MLTFSYIKSPYRQLLAMRFLYEKLYTDKLFLYFLWTVLIDNSSGNGVNIFLLYFFIFFIRSILLKYEFNLLHFFSAGHFINTCYFPCFRGCSSVHPQWRCPWMVSPLLFNPRLYWIPCLFPVNCIEGWLPSSIGQL